MEVKVEITACSKPLGTTQQHRSTSSRPAPAIPTLSLDFLTGQIQHNPHARKNGEASHRTPQQGAPERYAAQDNTKKTK